MHSFVNHLLQIYKQKLGVLRNLNVKQFNLIRDILRDPSVGYTDEEREAIPRLIATLDRLEAINQELKSAERNITNLDPEIIAKWREMMELVNEEHEILVDFLNPAIKGILERRDWQEWLDNFEHIVNFLIVLREDLRLFNALLKEIVKKGHLIELRQKSEQIASQRMHRAIKTPQIDITHLEPPSYESFVGDANLSPDIIQQITSIKQKLERYIAVLDAFLQIDVEPKIKGMLQQIRGRLQAAQEEAVGLLEGRVPFDPKNNTIQKYPGPSWRDLSIAIIDAFEFAPGHTGYDKQGKLQKTESSGMPWGEFYSDSRTKPLIEELIRLGGLKLISPEGGDRIDSTLHQCEFRGRPSPYPKGTVYYVIRPGYIWAGSVFRLARVEKSEGQPRL